MVAIVTVLLVVPLLTTVISSSELFTPEQLQSLDEYIQTVMICRKVPGLTLTVVQGDKVFTKAYGKRDVDKDINVTTDSLFCIGSITKAMTTALLSKLISSKTSWDTKLTDIFGDSFKLDTEDITKSATLKDILCHRTGKAGGSIGWIAGYTKKLTRGQMSKRLHYLPLANPFRYQYGYNNWMYFLAGHVAEVLAANNDTWEGLIRKNIFQPLGMNSTIIFHDWNDQPEREMALPYLHFDGSYHLIPLDLYMIHPLEPAGAVWSTGSDMSKWLQFILQSGNAPMLNNIVNATAFKDTMKPCELRYSSSSALYKPTFPVEHIQFGYGLGWVTASYRGRRQVLHSGALHAHRSLIWLYPELKTGLFISTNGRTRYPYLHPRSVILYYLSDLLFGDESWLNSTTACTFPEPWRKSPQQNTPEFKPTYPPQRPLKEYSGIYGNQLLGDMHVSVNNTEDVLQIAMGLNIQGFLFPTDKKDIFSWKPTGILQVTRPVEEITADRFHFYSCRSDKLDMLNVSAFSEFYHFDRNIRFGEISYGVLPSPSFQLSSLMMLYPPCCRLS